jgi:hypothetical protein
VSFFEQTAAALYGARDLIKILRWQHRVQDLEEAERMANRNLCCLLKGSLRAAREHNPYLMGDDRERLFCPAERLRQRRLFLTQQNQVGLGPEAMREGEVVVDFKGITLPFIVRRQGSFYRFVGAARMPESMRRNAMVQAEQGGAKMELMEIR